MIIMDGLVMHWTLHYKLVHTYCACACASAIEREGATIMIYKHAESVLCVRCVHTLHSEPFPTLNVDERTMNKKRTNELEWMKIE